MTPKTKDNILCLVCNEVACQTFELAGNTIMASCTNCNIARVWKTSFRMYECLTFDPDQWQWLCSFPETQEIRHIEGKRRNTVDNTEPVERVFAMDTARKKIDKNTFEHGQRYALYWKDQIEPQTHPSR